MTYTQIKAVSLTAIALLLPATAAGQMTVDQKSFDFQVMASLYAKRYAPYDWKKKLFNYDALALKPWLDQVSNTSGDLDYLELLVKYVAALNDTHSTYRIPSNYGARLGFTLDSCWSDDEKTGYACITTIDRTVLPASRYPFQIGDVVMSVDGVNADDLANGFLPFVSAASGDSGWRRAMDLIPLRSQAQLPRLPELGRSAQVVVSQQQGGTQTYTIPWLTSGVPLLRIGSVPSPTLRAVTSGSESGDTLPDYLKPLAAFWNASDAQEAAINGYGSRTPVWQLPADFSQRLGKGTTDDFFTGTMKARGHTVGFLRLGNFSPITTAGNALSALDKEIQFFQDNTDGLVVDIMRNTGGQVCYAEDVMSRLMPNAWQAMRYQLRPVWTDVSSFRSALLSAQSQNAPKSTVDLLTARYNDVNDAYTNGRGLTDPVSLCQSSPDRLPNKVVYTKPIVLLIDEFTVSSADLFAAMFQDNARGKLLGWRSNGAGGTVLDQPVGFYSEDGTARVVASLMYRQNPVVTDKYPTTNYVENVGVYPDIWFDYMNLNNIRKNGANFVSFFLNAAADAIEAK